MAKFITKTSRYTIDNNSSAKLGGTKQTNKQIRMVLRQAEGEEVKNCENFEFQWMSKVVMVISSQDCQLS